MKRVPPLIALMLLFFSTSATFSMGNEGELKQFVTSYVEAFNTGKAEEAAKFWAEDAVHTDEITGEKTVGREAILSDLKQAFADAPGVKMSGKLGSVQLITENVVKIEGEVSVERGDEAPSLATFTAILIRKDGQWLFASVDETEYAAPLIEPASLEQLQWLIGKWTDLDAESKIDSEFRWSANNAFLLRSFRRVNSTDEALAGTQVIAVDPRSNEIRSWTFLSDGSFGDEVWSSEGDIWTIRSVQTLADGRAASGTYVMQRVAENQLSVQLVGHEIEGVPQPTMPAIVVTRVDSETPAEKVETPSSDAGSPTPTDPTPNSRSPKF